LLLRHHHSFAVIVAVVVLLSSDRHCPNPASSTATTTARSSEQNTFCAEAKKLGFTCSCKLGLQKFQRRWFSFRNLNLIIPIPILFKLGCA
jgi:hypothetical protein